MLAPLQRLMPPRCTRRVRSPSLSTKHQVWCCSGHGDGQVHNHLLACLSGASISTVEHSLPGPDLPRSRKPLHAHVRHAKHGRFRTEPQECGLKPELDSEPVLLQQRTSSTTELTVVMLDRRDHLLTHPTDSPLCLLRPERNLLHRSLPLVILFAATLAHPLLRPQHPDLHPAWFARCTQAFHVLREPFLSSCHGDGSRE
jgi:hypothetical protein